MTRILPVIILLAPLSLAACGAADDERCDTSNSAAVADEGRIEQVTGYSDVRTDERKGGSYSTYFLAKDKNGHPIQGCISRIPNGWRLVIFATDQL